MSNIKLIKGDCLEKFKQIEDESIDLILIDPPYKCISGGNKKGLSYRHKGSITQKNDGKIFEYNDIKSESYIPELYRILKNNSDCYIMTNLLNLFDFKNICDKSKFKLHNLLVWEKQNCPPNRWYMKNCEYILYLYKGKAKPINDMGSKTVHKFINPQGDKLHPTQKPTDLLSMYITNSSNKNDVVLDCFMGSCSTGIACLETGRNFIGIEKDDKYFDISVNRINTYIKENNLNNVNVEIIK